MPAVGGNDSVPGGALSIREVLELLIGEFPDVTISKIRFLESRGLIHPERTPSGYRKFYEGDVERLRWILRQQRENFLPLKVIKGRLDQRHGDVAELTSEPSLFDDQTTFAQEEDRVATETEPAMPKVSGGGGGGGGDGEEPPRPPEPSTVTPVGTSSRATQSGGHDTELTAAPAAAREPAESPAETRSSAARAREGSVGVHLSAAELAGATGAPPELVATLLEFGLIRSKVVSGVVSFDERALEVTKLAAGFARHGIEPRHLRSLKHAAERQAALFSQVVAPLLRQRNPEARAKAHQDLAELAELGQALQRRFVDEALGELAGS